MVFFEEMGFLSLFFPIEGLVLKAHQVLSFSSFPLPQPHCEEKRQNTTGFLLFFSL